MGCRGAIHCAHLGSRGIPLGAMNCAPTPCAYLKGIDRKGQPYYTTDQPAKPVESSGVARGTLGSTLQLVRMGDRKDRPYYTTDRLAKPVYSRGDPLRSPLRTGFSSRLWGSAPPVSHPTILLQ